MLEEFRHPDIVVSSGIPLELDYYFPKLHLAIEYQVSLESHLYLTQLS